jgi:hypothetical protein
MTDRARQKGWEIKPAAVKPKPHRTGTKNRGQLGAVQPRAARTRPLG